MGIFKRFSRKNKKYPCKVGIPMPDEIKDRYETEPREFLVGFRSKSITGGIKTLQYDSLGIGIKSIIFANVDIVGYVDLTINNNVRSKASVCFTANYPCLAGRELSLEEADRQQKEYEHIKSLFQENKIYRIKGLAPISQPDLKQFNNEYHMQTLYLLEILSDNEENEFLQNLLDDWYNPIMLHTDEFGEMILDKEMGWYSVEQSWRRKPFKLRLKAEDAKEDVTEGLAALTQFWQKKASWDKKLRAFAGQQLLGLANDWASGDDENPDRIWTEESFAQTLKNECIVMDNTGNFEMWFDDGGIFLGHSVMVKGNIRSGATEAQMI